MFIGFIIKARATKTARPDYFAAETEINARELEAMLKAAGWEVVETREIKVRDARIEGVLKMCATGGERERANLQILFNEQEAA